jgi:hypothetical protein
MDREELITNGINGWRLTLAMMLRSKAYDVIMILLILMYTLLVFIYFALADSVF